MEGVYTGSVYLSGMANTAELKIPSKSDSEPEPRIKRALTNNNSTSRRATHFLAAVPLIVEARKLFNICSENWAYPTEWWLGTPEEDGYYAEVWSDGMDWNTHFWVIETIKHSSPKVEPLLHFETDRGPRFHMYVLSEFVRAILSFRRGSMWLEEEHPQGHYHDLWSYVHRLEEKPMEAGPVTMQRYKFGHGSQPDVAFYANPEFFPEHKR
jgi:hypothetical protein